MQMYVQQRRARGGDAATQRLIDVIDVIEVLCAIEVDDQVHAGAAHAVADHEVVFTVVNDRRNDSRLIFLSGGTWDPQALVRSQEGVLAHAVLPNQEKEPEMPASRRHGKRKPPDLSRLDRSPAARPPNKVSFLANQEDSWLSAACALRLICGAMRITQSQAAVGFPQPVAPRRLRPPSCSRCRARSPKASECVPVARHQSESAPREVRRAAP